MRQRLSLILTLTAWLLATGSQWDLVQTFAWGRMLATYAQTMPFTAAVRKTFAPQTMCSICHAVAAAKQQESGNPAVPSKNPGKILLACAPRALVFTSPVPSLSGRLAPLPAPAGADRPRPPTPPPRLA